MRAQESVACLLCAGTGWACVPDPLFDGAMVECRCPACSDLSARTTRAIWALKESRR